MVRGGRPAALFDLVRYRLMIDFGMRFPAIARRGAWIGALLLSLAAGVGGLAATAKPRTHAVAIRGFKYLPGSTAVRVGDAVVWTNHDLVPHTATAKPQGLDTGSMAARASARFVAKKRGVYRYVCAFHPTMKGTLVVR